VLPNGGPDTDCNWDNKLNGKKQSGKIEKAEKTKKGEESRIREEK
jgi:hypothetical protein